jgi:hypothetical protein
MSKAIKGKMNIPWTDGLIYRKDMAVTDHPIRDLKF